VSAEDDADRLAAQIGEQLAADGRTIAVAESLTGGLLVQALAKAQGSGEWLLGGVVAYASSVKHGLLGVSAERVVSAESAEQMAAGVRRRLGADVAVAVTGVAGPDRQEGRPPGEVWIGVDDGTSARASLYETSGEPGEIVEHTVVEALRHVAKALGQ
jgi:nicotinamide-nucleotide amidase